MDFSQFITQNPSQILNSKQSIAMSEISKIKVITLAPFTEFFIEISIDFTQLIIQNLAQILNLKNVSQCQKSSRSKSLPAFHSPYLRAPLDCIYLPLLHSRYIKSINSFLVLKKNYNLITNNINKSHFQYQEDWEERNNLAIEVLLKYLNKVDKINIFRMINAIKI